MKIYSIFVSFLIFTSTLTAGAQSQESIDQALKNYSQAQARFEVGEISRWDLLVAEKYLLETQLLKSPYDAAVYSALIQNLVSRNTVMNHLGKLGRLELIQADYIRNEIKLQAANCATLYSTLKTYFEAGEVTAQDVQLVLAACSSLAKIDQ